MGVFREFFFGLARITEQESKMVPQRLIRHLAEPNTSPSGQPAAVQNAARFVELGSSIFREAK